MSDEVSPNVRNQEKDPRYNRESGMLIIPGSNYANEMLKFEGRPGIYGIEPGNPYVYRPFPKMVYVAKEWKGTVVCNAAPPDMADFQNPDQYRAAEEKANRFTESCQRIVQDERELTQAMELGYRESPGEAVECLRNKQLARGLEAAHRAHDDRNMTAPAKREMKQYEQSSDVHVAEVPEAPRQKRKYTKRAASWAKPA